MSEDFEKYYDKPIDIEDGCGFFGDCFWVIYESGLLAIGPAEDKHPCLMGNSSLTDLPPWYAFRNQIKYIDIRSEMALNRKAECLFADMPQLSKIAGLEKLDTSRTDKMGSMFQNCGQLIKVDISAWDTRNLESASYMFACCFNLTEVASENFGKDNNRVFGIDTSGMFAGCTEIQSINLSSLHPTNMPDMFYNCSNLQTLIFPKLNLTEDYLAAQGAFENCNKLKGIYMKNPDWSKVACKEVFGKDFPQKAITEDDIKRDIEEQIAKAI